MNYHVVKFMSFTGQASIDLFFESKTSAQKVYDEASSLLEEFSKNNLTHDIVPIVVGNFTDDFGLCFSTNLANYALMLTDIEESSQHVTNIKKCQEEHTSRKLGFTSKG